MIDWNELQVFAKVVEQRGFAPAARALGLPVSSVSRKVARLERRLGTALLHRTTRRVALTDDGAAYYRQCERVLAEVRAAEQSLGARDEVPRGVLRVSAPITFGRFVLAPIIGEFTTQNREIRLTVVLTNRYVDLIDEEFDLAIRTGILPPSGLRARPLGCSPFVIAASPGCLARHGTPTSAEAFKTLPCLVLGEQAVEARWTFFADGQPESLPVNAAMVANDMDLLRHAAIAGRGFIMLPSFLLAAELADGRLQLIDGDWRLTQGEVSAVYPAHRVTSPKLRVFIDFLASHLREAPHWQAGGCGSFLVSKRGMSGF